MIVKADKTDLDATNEKLDSLSEKLDATNEKLDAKADKTDLDLGRRMGRIEAELAISQRRSVINQDVSIIQSCKSFNPDSSDKNYLTKNSAYGIINTNSTAQTPKYAFFTLR